MAASIKPTSSPKDRKRMQSHLSKPILFSADFYRPALPFWANFTAGAIAGVTEILIMYPLDVVKTRMQLDTGSKGTGLVASFRSIIAQEG